MNDLLKQRRSGLAVPADGAWRQLAKRAEHGEGAALQTENDDDATFAGSPDELDALLRDPERTPAPPRSKRLRTGVSFLIVVGASLALWALVALLLLR